MSVLAVLVLVSSCIVSSGEAWEADLISSLRRGEGPRTSEALYRAVRAALPRGRHVPADLGSVIVTAWDQGRPVPPVSVADLQAIFAGKRDAVRSCEVIYEVRTSAVREASKELEPRSSWWTRWWQRGSEALRVVSPSRVGLSEDEGDPARMTWRITNGRVHFARSDGSWRELRESGASILGLEDSWLGGGSCIGQSALGLARAAEHDLAAMLASLAVGTAIVESVETLVDGAACVVLRVGWPRPYWFYLDPAIDFAPRRIDRIVSLTGRLTISRTTMTNFSRCGGQWVPTSWQWSQHPLRAAEFGPGDEPEDPAEWLLEAEAAMLRINDEVCDCETSAEGA